MHVILTIDDNFGMMFNHRRLSKDRILNQHLQQMIDGQLLRLNAYSAPLFEGANMEIDSDFLTIAGPEDYCFVEGEPLKPYEDKIETLTVCRWNRAYPSDVKLDLDLSQWHLAGSQSITGSSHDKIDIETYVRERYDLA